jgi:hypothetical protein
MEVKDKKYIITIHVTASYVRLHRDEVFASCQNKTARLFGPSIKPLRLSCAGSRVPCGSPKPSACVWSPSSRMVSYGLCGPRHSPKICWFLCLRRIGGGLLKTFPLIVSSQTPVAGGAITLLGIGPATLARMQDAGVYALLGQALGAIIALAGHGFSRRSGCRGGERLSPRPADP